MKTQSRQLGDMGEDIARRFLIARGYRILNRNFVTRYGEIDIVAEKNGTLFFVEVKTARAETKIRPEENITREKINKLLLSARVYLTTHTRDDSFPWQLDAIIVRLGQVNKEEEIEHIENIHI